MKGARSRSSHSVLRTPGTAPGAAYVREMFARIAPRYDFLNHLLSLQADRWWRRTVARRFRHTLERPGARVLDLCCGTGDLALSLTQVAHPSARILGADFCHPMLERARDKLLRRRLVPMLAEADALVLPFADSSFHLVTHLEAEFLRKRFPRIYSTCLEFNIDLATEPAPVRPAAHYAMGGVATDLEGRTTLLGLYAAGEVACTGVHGANRLASNSLLEGLVFGARTGKAMVSEAGPDPPPHGPTPRLPRLAADPQADIRQLRDLLWKHVGIIRCGKELRFLAERLQQRAEQLEGTSAAADTGPPSRSAFEYRNMLLVAQLITTAALAREESRGAHYRSDLPYKVEKFRKHSCSRAGAEVAFR